MARPKRSLPPCPICSGTVRRGIYCSKTCSNRSRAKSLDVRFAEFDARAVITVAGCREWAGPRDKEGYAVITSDDDRQIRIGRLVLERTRGPLPPGHHALHSCDNPPCYAIDHLRAGTHQDNVDDKMARGRNPRLSGEALPQTKLTDAELREVWRLRGEGWTQLMLAEKFEVQQTTISAALRKRIYRLTPDY